MPRSTELATDGRLATRLQALDELRPSLEAAADAALARELTAAELEAVSSGLSRLDAVLRARAASLT